PIVGDDEEFVSSETKPAVQAGFIFQKAAALKRGLQNRHKAVLSAAASGLLTIVNEAHPSVSHIDAEVSLMSDEQDTGSVMNVAVIVDVDEKMVPDNLSLNPGMKDGNELRHADRHQFGCEDLDPKPVYVHQRI